MNRNWAGATRRPFFRKIPFPCDGTSGAGQDRREAHGSTLERLPGKKYCLALRNFRYVNFSESFQYYKLPRSSCRSPEKPGGDQYESKAMLRLLKNFARNDSGATAIEYGLIAALISVVCVVTMSAVGSKLNAKFTSVSNGLN